jgi:type I restriction-modification system DNA methylase subunit
MSLFQKSVEKKYLNELDSVLIDKKYKEFQDYFGNPSIQENIRNSKEEQFQEGFLRELFVSIFGYTLNPQPNFNLTTELKNIANSKKADGAILKGEDAIAVIELKGTDTTDLDKVETQAFGYKNHNPKCVYVITSNFEKLRFYIQNAVDHIDFDLFNLTREQFSLMWLCLAKDNLLNGLPQKIKESSLLQEENITKKLYADYSKFREAIYNNLVKNNPETDKLLLFKKTQKLLDRFLFIFFAEDRLLLPPNSISEIVKQWKTLKEELDEYVPLFDRFKKYFGYMNTGYKGNKYDIYAYNGGLFAPDEILDNISIDDEILHKHTLTLSNYDFETDVDVNILGHIFEHSLGEIENVQAEIKGEKIDSQKTKRKKDGIFYTPKYITKYIVENTVGKLCEDKRAELEIIDEEYAKGRKNRKKDTIKLLDDKLTDYRNWLLTLTILDPACGSGAFLNQALDFLISEHRKIDDLRAQLFGSGLVFSDITTDILEKNIYGVDLNEESVEIAKLSLWLRTAQKGRKLNKLNNNIKCGNSLIDDPDVSKDKAFNWQNEFPEIFSRGGFDVVIGNPPYAGRSSSINEIEKQFVRNRFSTSEGKFELYQLFIEKCFELAKRKKSYISLITPQTWLSIIQATKLRKLVFANNELSEIVFLGKDVFEDASVDSIVFVISCGLQNSTISFLQSNNLLNLDSVISNISYSSINSESYIIPLSSDTKSLNLLDKIKANTTTLEKIGTWSDGVKIVGNAKDFAFQKTKVDDSFFPMLVGKDIERYTFNWGGLYCCRDKQEIEKHNATDIRLREESMYRRNKILIRKTGSEIVATIDTNNFYNEQSLFSFGVDIEGYSLNYVLGILNSKFANFLLKENAFSKKDTFPQIRLHWLKEFPIPKESDNKEIEQLVINIQEYYKSYFSLVNRFVKFLSAKLNFTHTSNKLQNWNELDFSDFIKEINSSINKSGQEKLSKSSEMDWMEIFEVKKTELQNLKNMIDNTNKDIDRLVYKLYGLTEQEIKIVEDAI